MNSTPHCLVVLGHPNPDSLCAALARAYCRGIEEAGGTAELLELESLQFDPILRTGLHGDQVLEPDLLAARASIERADHVAWVFPVWWGSTPALLKGFIDRTFLPGWAFNARPSGVPEGLLAGRTSQLLVTMDSPTWFDRLWYGASARRSMERATLWYTGFRRLRSRVFSTVLNADATKRARWLRQAHADGVSVARRKRRRSVTMTAVSSPSSATGRELT